MIGLNICFPMLNNEQYSYMLLLTLSFCPPVPKKIVHLIHPIRVLIIAAETIITQVYEYHL